jgi:hypothetical protein
VRRSTGALGGVVAEERGCLGAYVGFTRHLRTLICCSYQLSTAVRCHVPAAGHQKPFRCSLLLQQYCLSTPAAFGAFALVDAAMSSSVYSFVHFRPRLTLAKVLAMLCRFCWRSWGPARKGSAECCCTAGCQCAEGSIRGSKCWGSCPQQEKQSACPGTAPNL